ncbi:hypothetical protein HDF18_02595 [Mucilaginibacter sp. X5P1]|uniref:hypothetical protein n=1 Tax=Mucilaginibacter sp. X5P1 TaxID=2723088 RepID=UPI001609D77B|nr:hypothetical protein [Mucilaginibacter sp. X5P1]MBB6137995.1 hypothetical protein [Mucilaginibacter sp. X5P1]
MNPTEQFGLNWLLNAMTCPETRYKRYYYDSIQQFLFHIVLPNDRDGPILFYDALGISVDGKVYHELFMRMENCHRPFSGIVEICRFTIVQKVDVQRAFLKRLHKWKYLIKVTDQQEEGTFILDEVLCKPEYALLEPVWRKFKLEVARYYVQSLSRATGIQVDLSR